MKEQKQQWSSKAPNAETYFKLYFHSIVSGTFVAHFDLETWYEQEQNRTSDKI